MLLGWGLGVMQIDPKMYGILLVVFSRIAAVPTILVVLILFVLSDFIDDDYEQTLKIISNKHDVTGIRIFDKRETEIPNLGMVTMQDAETNEVLLVNTASSKVRRAYKNHYLEQKDYFENAFKRSGAGFINTETNESYVKKLLLYFKQKGAR